MMHNAPLGMFVIYAYGIRNDVYQIADKSDFLAPTPVTTSMRSRRDPAFFQLQPKFLLNGSSHHRSGGRIHLKVV
jgi:hypothetical protein